MKINRKVIIDYLKESLIGSSIWTLFLSPYAIFIMKLNFIQYVGWLSMQFVLIMPLLPIVVKMTKFLMEKL